MAAIGRKWVMVKHFDGLPKRSDLQIQDFKIPELQNGEVLLEAVVLSVDPYMRPFMSNYDEGTTMIGEQVAKVIKTRNPKYEVGVLVLVSSGWVTHTVSDGSNLTKLPALPKTVPVSYALGGLGMPAIASWIGLTRVAKIKEGETVYVNGAAGAVGTSVGQIAKIKGCRVIGSAGSDEKVKFLKEELGFDEAFNYKTVGLKDLDATLKKLAPNGIDVFYENVGGEASSIVTANMNMRGRIAVCGVISSYNAAEQEKVTSTQFLHNAKRLTTQGFVVYDHPDLYPLALKDLIQWTNEGKLKFREKVHKGFELMYDAFIELFKGSNIGKVVVYAASE